MYIIVGLGNPGKKYENTRHNMGFLTIDRMAEEYGISVDKIKFKALVGEGRIAGQRVVLVKPQTYMNLSGQSVQEIMHFYKEDIENLIVIYDDLDIPAGKIRVRIRVGIGGEKKGDLIDFVIGGVSKSEMELLREATVQASRAAAAIVEKGIEKAMNEYNIKEKKPKKQKAPEAAPAENPVEEEVKND